MRLQRPPHAAPRRRPPSAGSARRGGTLAARIDAAIGALDAVELEAVLRQVRRWRHAGWMGARESREWRCRLSGRRALLKLFHRPDLWLRRR